jgi:succinate dehydrogenase / fumarate reductase iron-sulfur subunit
MIEVTLRVRDGEGFVELSGSFPEDATVLDALEILRARAEGADPAPRVPPYRHSCHHGSCGTCGAVINGLPALMCLTRFSDLAVPRPREPGGPAVEPGRSPRGELVVTLEPLPRGTVISGIAARPAAALEGIPGEYSYLRSSDEAGRAPLPADPTRAGGELPANAYRVRFEACIECGLCSAACPVRAPFLGPAALAAVNRRREKAPESAERMLALAARPDGVAACERHLHCSRVCPQAVYPGKHIQLLKNALAGRTQ